MPKIIQGDCLEIMASLEDNSIDALVTDSPYGFGFMGEKWDTFKSMDFLRFSYKWSKAALRILKPGAYLLNFSAPKKYHLMACGVELAGYNIKDCIFWCYGAGFPKSLDISKAIDNYYGLERNIIGKEQSGKPESHKIMNMSKLGSSSMGGIYDITKSNSKEAQQWNGWGTGLKPAFEPIVVAQKPIEGTYAENVLKHGVGGLNIDGCRIGYTQDKETDSRIYDQDKNITRGSHGENSVVNYAPDGNEFPMYNSNKGRFPSNLILTHHPECRLIGSKEVGSGNKLKSIETNRTATDNFFVGKNPNKTLSLSNYGIETIEAYECHPDCPIRMLDKQSGETKSSKGGFKPTNERLTHQWSKDPNWNKQEYFNRDLQWYNDKGGASRFFYCGKAYKTERNAGLLNINITPREELTNRKEDSAGQNHPRCSMQSKEGYRNTITTLKPINIMRYLVRLVTPPNGVVLDPFAGSGTTGIACIIEGFDYILIEKRKRFANVIIPKRLEYWKDPKNWEVLKDHNILPKIKTLKKKRLNQSIEGWLR